jgi:crotonobetainyl-CoA:carnitine CoA-transferase CaiB-like acyl-CoA transferase
MIQAMSGLMSITGHADDQPGGGPMRMGVALIDILTGIYACSAILAAVEARHTTGAGQHIDMALLDVGMAVLANQAAGFLNTGQVPQRQGNTHPSLAPYQTFDTLDGNMLLAIGNDGQFARFCEAAGQPAWAADARFRSNTLRVKNREALLALMLPVTRKRSTADWIRLLEDKAVPCGPINNLAQAFGDAQVQARGLVIKQPLALINKGQVAIKNATNHATVTTVASPLRLLATPPVLHRAPPQLGQHTDEVLLELGLDATQISALRGRGVV